MYTHTGQALARFHLSILYVSPFNVARITMMMVIQSNLLGFRKFTLIAQFIIDQ